jgi:hypothetical protein
MIRWLDEQRLSPTVKANVARFRATSFAKDLDEGESVWRFMSWPRSAEAPLVFLLRSDDHRHASFTIDNEREYGHIATAETGSHSDSRR